MLDIKYIREQQDKIRKNIANRGVCLNLDDLLNADKKRRELQEEIDNLKNKRKKIRDPKEGKKIKNQLKKLEIDYNKNLEVFTELVEKIPNITHPDSPIGRNDQDNKEIEAIGKIPTFDFKFRDHVELGKILDIIDFDAGSKIAGARFYYLKRAAVLLDQALIGFAYDLLQKKNYIHMITPDLVCRDKIKASGFNPRDDSDQIYNITNTDLSLIATSEITIGGYHSNMVIDEEKLPMKYVGLSHCFRKEAGTYGKESRGLYRVHQFTKVEMYIICHPDESEKMHQELLEIEKDIYTKLEIPFRVVDVCTGDLGGPAYRKYDLEAWMPMRNGYGEITSTSNCTDFQARRLNIKYKDKQGKKHFVHTLNGTAIAISRILLSILENNQQADGSVIVPKALRPYMNNLEIIKPVE